MSKIADLINERVIEPLKSQIKLVVDAKAKLLRLSEALESNKKQKEILHGTIAKLVRESTELLAQGKSYASKQTELSKAKAELSEVDEWVVRLEVDAIPLAQKSVKDANEDLRLKVQERIRQIKPEVQRMFEATIVQADSLQAEWGLALSKLRETIGIGVSDSPEEARGYILLANKDSAFHVLEKFIRG